MSRPNVVLIMADDMGFECLSCYGSTTYETPVLDDLASRGIRFSHCYSTPLCTPSRVEIMTGQYNFRNYDRFAYLNPKEKTFGNLLQDAGYATCVAGKWQLSKDNKMPAHFGFDEHCLWNMTPLPEDPARAAKGRYAHPQIERNGEWLPDDYIEDRYGPDICCDYLLDFIERHRDVPFFAYYPMILVHAPFVPTPDSPEWRDRDRRDEKDTRYFADMVAYADKLVGRIVERLEALDLLENTLVMFTSDNGTHRTITSQLEGGVEIVGGKGTMPDAGTHVPFIAFWKGVAPEDVVSDDLVDFSDFLPTLMDLADAPIPEGMPCDGRSFLPQLRGERGDPRDWIFCHYNPRFGFGQDQAGQFAREHRFKIYHDGRFYDVPADRLEDRDIVLGQGDAESEEARERLQKVLNMMPDFIDDYVPER